MALSLIISLNVKAYLTITDKEVMWISEELSFSFAADGTYSTNNEHFLWPGAIVTDTKIGVLQFGAQIQIDGGQRDDSWVVLMGFQFSA